MSPVIVVAIDGPAGSGKSSVSKEVARRLGYAYLDTGAAYRALAWHVVAQGANPAHPAEVVGALDSLNLTFSTNPDEFVLRMGEIDVTREIREPRITSVVSAVSRVPQVRERLNRTFRDVIDHCQQPGIVVEGRDITTVVAPEAQVRILLTADEATRMKRRGLELPSQSASDLTRQIRDRDVADSQVSDFMSAADGVITLDSTHLDFGQTVDAVLAEAARVGLIS